MELLEALKTIKDECERHDYCNKCPLRRPDNPNCCGITYSSPSKWTMSSPTDPPSVFKS